MAEIHEQVRRTFFCFLNNSLFKNKYVRRMFTSGMLKFRLHANE